MKWFRKLGVLAAAPLTGCAAIGPVIGGASSLVSLAVSLAMIALPLAAAWYFYQKD